VELPNEMLFEVAKRCTFRSIVMLGRTCSQYHELLKNLVSKRKECLLSLSNNVEIQVDELKVIFMPGPTILHLLPSHFPVDGIYFVLDPRDNNPDINFFIADFDAFFKKNDRDMVATTKTKTNSIHRADVGGFRWRNNGKLDVYRKAFYFDKIVFRIGKKKIKEFWDSL
jgi:hypothetical protein